ncbi:hypothetical protein OPW39_15520 [Vibrio europaeus]|uniref:hypothetical protein n=1 Tax=Vibrio europaeus TaxID=300876 RepID=UPI00233F0697|nr:hypothetical protein [Vibrio europaeus]MDC5870216.1 hypothetical protein [Vibrio europaeus]
MGISYLPSEVQSQIRHGLEQFAMIDLGLAFERPKMSSNEFKGYLIGLKGKASFKAQNVVSMVTKLQNRVERFGGCSVEWSSKTTKPNEITLNFSHEGGMTGTSKAQDVQFIVGECMDQYEGVVALEVTHECKRSELSFVLKGYIGGDL